MKGAITGPVRETADHSSVCSRRKKKRDPAGPRTLLGANWLGGKEQGWQKITIISVTAVRSNKTNAGGRGVDVDLAPVAREGLPIL